MSGCRSCSGRLFHSVGAAVAKQRSPDWLHDLLIRHVRLRRLREAVLWWQVAHSEDDKYSGAFVGTFAALTYKAAVKFKAQSVAGFSDDAHGYSYFITIQPRAFDPISDNPSSDTESKLIQVLCPFTAVFVQLAFPCKLFKTLFKVLVLGFFFRAAWNASAD